MKPIIRWRYDDGWWFGTLPDGAGLMFDEIAPFPEKLLAEFASLHQVKR